MTSKHEPKDASYGRYTGTGTDTSMDSQTYAQQQYDPPYTPPQGLDDNFADMVAERVVQRLRQDMSGKIYPQAQPRDKNMLRMIIALVSIFLFFPFAFLFLIMVGGIAGWVSFAIVGFTIFVLSLVTLDKVK